MLTKKDKGDIKEIVVDVIQKVIMPAFETVATKSDLKKVETRLDKVENRLENVEMKLDRVVDTQIVYETRMKKLETKRALA